MLKGVCVRRTARLWCSDGNFLSVYRPSFESSSCKFENHFSPHSADILVHQPCVLAHGSDGAGGRSSLWAQMMTYDLACGATCRLQEATDCCIEAVEYDVGSLCASLDLPANHAGLFCTAILVSAHSSDAASDAL